MDFTNKRNLLLIPIIGITVSILICITTLQYEIEKEKSRFVSQSNLIFNNIWSSFNDLDNINESISLLFNTSDVISEDQFNLFIHPTIIRYPFIENIYYIPRIEKINVQQIEQQKQNEGYTGFHFRDFPKDIFSPSPIEKYLFPISYVQPYTVITSTLIGRDILTFKQVQEAIIDSTDLSNAIVLSPSTTGLYAFSSLYFGKGQPKTKNINIDNVYAILGFKISPIKLIQYIKLPKSFKLKIIVNGINFVPTLAVDNFSVFDIEHVYSQSYGFNGQLIEARIYHSKYFLSYTLTLPIFVLLLGLILTYLIWYVFRKHREFNIILYKQNKIIEFEVNEKTDLLKKQTLELKVAYEDQLSATKELKSFSYSISHDLRTPLRTVDGFCKILEEDYAVKLDDKGKNYIKRIRKGSQHMGQLIDSMLNIALVSHKDLKNEPVSLSNFAHNIITELKSTHPERDIEIIIAENLTANGDPALLYSVIENLLNNAWKFTSKTSNAKIEFNKNDTKDFEFFIKDNGVGFDMAYSDKLFTPFQRLHGNQFKGSGVGLATVKRIIKRHRGEINVVSALNEGTTFTFTFGQRE